MARYRQSVAVHVGAVRNAVRLGLLLALLGGCSTTPEGPQRVDVPPEVREAFNAAMLAIEQEKFEKSEEILSGVVSQSQQTVIPHINLALVQMRLDKLEEAEETLKAALAIEPLNPMANNELGLLYRKTGRFQESRQVYERILEKYPRYPAANKNLGILCDLYLRDYECAYQAYKAYSEAVPDDENAEIWIVDVKRRAGR